MIDFYVVKDTVWKASLELESVYLVTINRRLSMVLDLVDTNLTGWSQGPVNVLIINGGTRIGKYVVIDLYTAPAALRILYATIVKMVTYWPMKLPHAINTVQQGLRQIIKRTLVMRLLD